MGDNGKYSVLALAVLGKPGYCLTIRIWPRLDSWQRRNGTVLLTGPTGGLGRAATLAIANRSAPERPDLLLVGSPVARCRRWPRTPGQ
jgi:hypothetical protein